MPKHVFENSCPFSSIFIYIASITTLWKQDVGLQSVIYFIESTAGIMSPGSFLISYNIVILHFMKNERSSYMHALRAYFWLMILHF